MLPYGQVRWGVIFIQRSDAVVSPLSISEFFKIKKPSVPSVIKVLEKEGYMINIPSPEEGRSFNLKLTEKRNTLVRSTFKDYLKFVELRQGEMGEFLGTEEI